MYATLQNATNEAFDVVMLSSYFVTKMVSSNLIQPIEHQKISAIADIDPKLLRNRDDPENQYSLPYIWGASGIAINTKYIDPKSINSWNDLCNKDFQTLLAFQSQVSKPSGCLKQSLRTMNLCILMKPFRKEVSTKKPLVTLKRFTAVIGKSSKKSPKCQHHSSHKMV